MVKNIIMIIFSLIGAAIMVHFLEDKNMYDDKEIQ
jgi:hypothetical protein